MIKPDRRTLEKFSFMIFIASSIIGSFLLMKQSRNFIGFYLFGVIFMLIGIMNPFPIRYFYILCRELAVILSWVNTRLLLLFIFYIVLTPIGIILKVSGKDLLDRKLEKHRKSYWKETKKDTFVPLLYERQS